ncbi:MAG TPA: hypothetical protein VFJ22_11785 [Dermatophilaceae bacterium]|jgi:hypothetical protein|nr:hypothetical protein [Dermatophilaceae bacterium]
MKTSRSVILAATACAALSTLVTIAPAQASGGTTAVATSGSCSATSTWKLKAKPELDLGTIQIEFSVDSNKVGQIWAVRLADNTTTVFSGHRTTLAPSGSFTVKRLTADQAGTDLIRARATNPATGEVCSGQVRL